MCTRSRGENHLAPTLGIQIWPLALASSIDRTKAPECYLLSTNVCMLLLLVWRNLHELGGLRNAAKGRENTRRCRHLSYTCKYRASTFLNPVDVEDNYLAEKYFVHIYFEVSIYKGTTGRK